MLSNTSQGRGIYLERHINAGIGTPRGKCVKTQPEKTIFCTIMVHLHILVRRYFMKRCTIFFSNYWT